MPNYKVLGIYSFAENWKTVNLNDSVILKKDVLNIKSKNAIAVYSLNNKKLGYLPTESQSEIKNFNNSYKITKLLLNQDNPLCEISRYYTLLNYISNIEYPYEKKLKYKYKLVSLTPEISKAVVNLEKYLLTKKIKVKRTAIIYFDDNYINILIEISKGFEQFECITLKYFKDNNDKFEEFEEYGLIDNIFFRELLFYRLECYIEKKYTNILDYNHIENKNELFFEKILDPLENPNNIDLFLFTKLYLRYLITKNNYYLLKFFNINDNLEITLEENIPNYNILDIFFDKYNLQLGSLYYDHKLKIYDYIDFITTDTIFIIESKFIDKYLYTCYLTNKPNIIVYNPEYGNIEYINN